MISFENAQQRIAPDPVFMEAGDIPVTRSRQSTPNVAVQSFDGNIQMVRARHMILRQCGTRQMWQFLLHAFALIFAIVLGGAMMIVTMYEPCPGNAFAAWSSLLTFGLGAAVPNPKFKRAGAGEEDSPIH